MPSPNTTKISSLVDEKPNSLLSISNSIISGGTFVQHNYDQRQYHVHTGSKNGYDKLVENVSPAAFHNSGERYDPPRCHPNTRVAVIQKIMDWITGSDDEIRDMLIMWLSGAAGAGKSAIGQSVAERCFSEGRLLASFFFGRLDPTRNHSRSLVPTIAYQLCSGFPEAQPFISSVIDKDPLIFSRSLIAQFTALVLDPLSHLTTIANTDLPHFIIVDGLDECLDVKAQQEVINTLFDVTQRSHHRIFFLVCSRPENQISSSFNSTKLKSVLTRLFLDDNYLAREDIELYLRDNFAEIKSSHVFKSLIPATWPTDEVISNLVKKSSGQFIYAATVVRYTQSTRHMPHYRLDALLNLRPPFRDLPFAELDAVYAHVFSTVEDIQTALDVLALLVIHVGQSVLPVSEMEKFLDLEPGYIHITFLDLGSLVEIKENMSMNAYVGSSNYSIRLLHASLVDFLLDPKRSRDLSFDPRIKHTQQVLQVLQRLTIAAQNGNWPNDTSILSCFTFLHFDGYDFLLSFEHADVLNNFSLPSTFLFMLSQERDLPQIGIYITEFLRPLFRALQLSDDPVVHKLHLSYRNNFSKFILRQLQEHFIDDYEFNFQFFLAHMHPIGHKSLPKNFWSITFQRHPKTLRADIFEYILLTRFPNYADGELAFRKPSWARVPCLVREQIYAKTALYCFEYLCNRQGPDAKSVFRPKVLNYRTKNDRFWRLRRRSGRSRHMMNDPWILATRPSSIANPYPTKLSRSQNLVNTLAYRHSDFKFYGIRDLRKLKERTWSARYPQLLAYLNYFLPRSAPNELLAQACRDSVFPSRSQDLPDEMRRLRRKIADYLRRIRPL